MPRSTLLDRPGQPTAGMIRDFADNDGQTLYRSYVGRMREKHGRVPTLAESFAGMIACTTTDHDPNRSAIARALNSTEYHVTGTGSFGTPAYMTLPGFLGLETQQRTMTEITGSSGGFAVAPGYSDRIIDRGRTTQGPWSRCNIWEVSTREYNCPVVYETSRAAGSRYGGVNSQWGLSEIKMPSPADGMLANIQIVNERLLMLTQMSRDVFADSLSIGRWLNYVGIAEFRDAIENAMLNNGASGVGPVGVVNAPSTVVVPKGATTSNEISVINIQAMYSAIADGNTENMCWHAGRDTIDFINSLATMASGSQYPLLEYSKAWSPGNPNPFPMLMGKPLFTSEFCQPLGTKGDLIAVDWSDYVLTWIRPKPYMGALAFAVGLDMDPQHKGLIGMPEGSVEARVSDQQLFSTDTLVLGFKYRGGGSFFWPNTSTTANGSVVGPAAVLQSR
jgi:HK97 family phage major capsid protein